MTMSGRTDPLFERLARGEPGAMEEICLRYGKRVMQVARRRLGRELRKLLETADVAQDAMMAVIQRAPGRRFESEEYFLRWVNWIIEQTIIGAARRSRAARRCSRKEVPLEGALEPVDPKAQRPSQIFARGEISDRILMALYDLPPLDRQAITARLILRLQWNHVATALGTTKAAAQMRFQRARQRLSAALLKPGSVRPLREKRPPGIRSGPIGPLLALLIAAAAAALPGCGWVPALVVGLVANSGGHSKEATPAPPGPETLKRGAGPYQILPNEPVGLELGRFLPEENKDFSHLGAAVIYRDERLVTFFRGDGTGRLIEEESVQINGESAVALAAVPAPGGSPWGLLVASNNTLELIRWDQGMKISLMAALEGIDPNRRLTVGDFDGDGSPDVAVSSFENGWVEIFQVPGNGEPLQRLMLPGPPLDLSAGAFFPDPVQRSDLAVLVEEDNTNSILLYVARSGGAGGGGIFCEVPDATTGPLTDRTFSLSKADALEPDPIDLNCDGTPDLAYTREDGTGTVINQATPEAIGGLSMQNRGGGHFSPVPTGMVLLRLPDPDAPCLPDTRAAFGRATSDAMLEAVVISYFKTNGKDFESTVSYPLPGAGLGLAAGDLNGDGWTDLVATAGKDGRFSLVTFLANPPKDSKDQGVLATPFHIPFACTAGESPRTVSSTMDCAFGHAGDAGDPEPFLAAVDNTNREVVVKYLGTPGDPLGVNREERYSNLDGRPWSILIRDFDGDGLDDIVVSAYSRIHFLKNQGKGKKPRFEVEVMGFSFGELIARAPNIAGMSFDNAKISTELSAGPLDNTGFIDQTLPADLVIPFSSDTANGLLVIRNGLPSGEVRFYPMSLPPSQVAIANLNDDRALDLLVALNDEGNSIQFLMGDPNEPGTFLPENPAQGLFPIQDPRRRTGYRWVETDNGPLARSTSSMGWPRAQWVVGINDYYAVAYFNSQSGDAIFDAARTKVIYSGEDPESVLVYDLFRTGNAADIAIVDENRDAVVLLRETGTPGEWFQESTLLTAGLPQRVVPFDLGNDRFLAVVSRSQQEIVVYRQDCLGPRCTYQEVRTLLMRRPNLTGPRTGMALAPQSGGGYLAALAREDEEDIMRAEGEFILDRLKLPGSGVDLADIGSLGASGMNRLTIADPESQDSQDSLHRGVLLTDVDRDGTLDLLTFDPGSREVSLRINIEGAPQESPPPGTRLLTLEKRFDPLTEAELVDPLIDWSVAAGEGDSTWIAISTERGAFLYSISAGLDSNLEWKSETTDKTILQAACGWKSGGKNPRVDLFFAILDEDGIRVDEPAGDPIFRIEKTSKIGRIGVRDFNGDGLDDLAVVDGLELRVYLATSKKGQLFSSEPQCVVTLPRFTDPVELVFLEANGDGGIDIGYGARDGAIFVFLGNGRGTFGDPAELNAAPDLEALRAADLDGDGIDEILAAVGAPGLIILPGR